MALRCGVIGLGYWGPNILRNLASSSATEVVAICDSNMERCSQIVRQYAVPLVSSDPQDLFDRPDIEALFIATPVSNHYPLVLAALRAGKHVFVEKPLAATVAHAEQLVEEAEKRGLRLMVDHVFVYSPAVRKIRQLITENVIGDVLYYDSVRVNLGLFQHDVNVIWDLAVHDLSIIDYVIDGNPSTILTQARAHVRGQAENMAYITCTFDSPLIAHCHVNWLAPVKVRRTLVGGTRRMIVYDDLEPDEKIKVYDRGLDITAAPQDKAGLQFGYRLGDMSAPMLSGMEALKGAVEHFAECVVSGTTPTTDGHSGLRVVRLLEAASRSAREDGRAVRVEH
jgi:predicted dehydrogenase